MAEIDDVANQVMRTPKGTPEYDALLGRLRELRSQELQQGTGTGATPTQPNPATPPAATDGTISYDDPDTGKVRAAIRSLPDEQQRTRAYEEWARKYVPREREQGGTMHTIDDVLRAGARGAPIIGPYLDELSAATGPGDYAENIAYQRERDRDFATRNPWGNFGAEAVGGFAAPLLRGAGALRNIGYNAVLGTVGGFGHGEGDVTTSEGLWNRGKQALTEGGLSAGLTTVMQPVSNYLQRFSRGNTTPEVDAAARRANVDMPYFARAADEGAQAEGRRAAQLAPGSNLGRAYDTARNQFDESIGNITQTNLGAPPSVAPNVAGRAITPGMERTAQGAERARGALADEIAGLVPPGARVDPAASRAALDRLVAARAEVDPQTATQGLERLQRAVNQPGGMSWAGNTRFNTELGQTRVGPPTNEPASLATSDFRPIYQASQGVDRPGFIESVAGTAGRARFETNTAAQAELARLQEDIAAAIGNRTPEQLINLIQNAASVRGGTNLDQIAHILGSLTQDETRQAGAGLLGNIANRAQVDLTRGTEASRVTNPAAVARQIHEMTPGARAGFFPPGTPLGDSTEALRLIGQRLGQVNQHMAVGSAKTTPFESLLSSGPVGAGAAASAAAKYLGTPSVAAAIPLVAGGGKYLWDLVRGASLPYAAQHGIPGGNTGARTINDLARELAARPEVQVPVNSVINSVMEPR